VFIETEDTALVEADTFKDTVSIQETVVEDRDFGFGFWIKFSVDVNFHGVKRGDVGLKNYTFPARSRKNTN
jgi:hypothetical protein